MCIAVHVYIVETSLYIYIFRSLVRSLDSSTLVRERNQRMTGEPDSVAMGISCSGGTPELEEDGGKPHKHVLLYSRLDMVVPA